MRKFTLVISMLAMGSFVFGQQMNNAQQKLSKMTDNSVETTTQSSKRDVIGAGDIIFSETFDANLWSSAIDANLVAIPANMPNGWTAYDGSGNNFFIRWSLTGARGAYTSPGDGPDALVIPNPSAMVKSNGDANGTEKGFLLLECDFYNTTPAGVIANPPIDMDTYVQTRAIDASANGAVSIYLEQHHRFCCGSYSSTAGPKLLVSTDNSTWTQFDIDQAAVNATPQSNPSVLEMSITSVAANQSTVYLRFHIMGESHYYWSVDDISLYEPVNYDTRMIGFWVDYYKEERVAYEINGEVQPDHVKGFNGIPFFGAYPAIQPLVKGRARAANFGAQPLTNLTLTTKVLQGDSKDANAVELFTATSTPLAIHALGAIDTLEIDVNYQIAREAASIGAYHTKGILAMNETDDAPDNNVNTFDFNVTENIFSYINPKYANTDRVGPFEWVDGIDGSGIGSMYYLNPPTEMIPGTQIPAPHIAQGVNVYVNSDNYNYIVWEGGSVAYLVAELYKGTLEGEDWVFDEDAPVLTSASIAIDSLMANSWVFLPFQKDEVTELITPEVEGHPYMVVIRFTTGDLNFYIGADKFTQSSRNSLWIDLTDKDFGWTAGKKGISMELIMNKYGTNPQGSIQFMIEMASKGIKTPAEGATLTFHTQSAQNTAVSTDYPVDATGLVTIDALRLGSYAYTLKWTTTENRDTTRNGRVALTKTGLKNLNLIINADNSVGIDAPVMELSMYPNPANNSVTIESSVAASRIVVSNIVGQVVDVVNNPTATQTISVSDYATGVYMVTIYDNEGNKVTKRLIKQ